MLTMRCNLLILKYCCQIRSWAITGVLCTSTTLAPTLFAAAPPKDPVPTSKGEAPELKTRPLPPASPTSREPLPTQKIVIPADGKASEAKATSEYVLGPQDVISVQSMHMEELQDRVVPIDLNGAVRLPMIGRVAVAGLTPSELERELTERYHEYIKDPELTVTVKEYRSQPISVLGAVRTPGVLQVQGKRSLFEVISMAGGLADDAGFSVTITRRRDRYGDLPLSSATTDATGNYSVAQVNVRAILDATDPASNIAIYPEDVVTVPTAKMVYVLGTVQRTGGFALNEEESVTVLQAVALAQGFDRFAKPDKSVILRKQAGSSERTEIAVNVKAILEGKAEDQALRQDDILYIPDSAKKRALSRAVEATIGVGSGVAIWRVGRP